MLQAQGRTSGPLVIRPYAEWEREERIPLEQVPLRFPELKRSTATLVRYHKVGCVSRTTGLRVHLDCMAIPGGMYFTSIEAVNRFLDALNGIGVDLTDLVEPE